ncbi:MAG: HEAT repeat domain-containing protein, partial [Pirellulales bacterium]
GLWLIERRAAGGIDAQTIERLIHDPSRLVRVHLLKALAERVDWSGGTLDIAALARASLDDADAFVRRAAADALGRHPQFESVAPLLKLWRTTPGEDSHLIHVVRMALRDHLAQPGIYASLSATALDTDDRSRLADVSLGVHTSDSAAYLLGFIHSRPIESGTPEYLHEIARYLPAERTTELYAWLEKTPCDDVSVAREMALALHRAGQARGSADPERLSRYALDAARKLLSSEDMGLVRSGVDVAREMRLAPLYSELAALVAAEGRPVELRSAAIDACLANDAPGSIALLAQVLGESEQPPALRQKAAAALANLQETAAREALVGQLRTAHDRLAVEIAAGLASRPEGAEALLAEVQAGRAAPRLLQERVVEERLRNSKPADLLARLAELTANLPPADERINQLISGRREGFLKSSSDAAAGRQVFQKTCAACHRIGGEGGKI